MVKNQNSASPTTPATTARTMSLRNIKSLPAPGNPKRSSLARKAEGRPVLGRPPFAIRYADVDLRSSRIRLVAGPAIPGRRRRRPALKVSRSLAEACAALASAPNLAMAAFQPVGLVPDLSARPRCRRRSWNYPGTGSASSRPCRQRPRRPPAPWRCRTAFRRLRYRRRPCLAISPPRFISALRSAIGLS